MAVFVDTNVLFYAEDSEAGSKQTTAVERLRGLWESREGVVSTQVLQELYVNLVRTGAPTLSAVRARSILRNYMQWSVITVEPALILVATEIQERNRLSFWDALIVAAAGQAGAATLLTEDLNHGQLIEGVRVENPFAEPTR